MEKLISLKEAKKLYQETIDISSELIADATDSIKNAINYGLDFAVIKPGTHGRAALIRKIREAGFKCMMKNDSMIVSGWNSPAEKQPELIPEARQLVIEPVKEPSTPTSAPANVFKVRVSRRQYKPKSNSGYDLSSVIDLKKEIILAKATGHRLPVLDFLSKKYGISPSMISSIKTGRNFGGVSVTYESNGKRFRA